MKKEEMLLSAMGYLEDDLLMEAKDYKKTKQRSRGRGWLIAACIAAALAVSAGAVGYTMHRAARADLGIDDLADIPEYTEYPAEEVPPAAEVTAEPDAPAEGTSSAAGLKADPEVPHRLLGGPVQLVSTLCSGNELVAYISVSGVTQEMEAWLEKGDIWDVGSVGPYQYVTDVGVDQADYDPETQTALLRLFVKGSMDDKVTLWVDLIYRALADSPDADYILYDSLEIPVTESASLHADLNRIVTHPDMEAFTAVLQSVDVYAGYISVSVQAPSLDELLETLGDDALTILGEAVYGTPLENEFQAIAAYNSLVHRMMNPHEPMNADLDDPENPDYIMEGAVLNLSGGSGLVLADLDREFAGEWTSISTDLNDAIKTGQWIFDLMPTKALKLIEIESITICGETYPLLAQ